MDKKNKKWIWKFIVALGFAALAFGSVYEIHVKTAAILWMLSIGFSIAGLTDLSTRNQRALTGLLLFVLYLFLAWKIVRLIFQTY